MAQGVCDICKIRPATTRVTVIQNGERRSLEVCEIDYARLRQAQFASPFESLFSGFFPGLGDESPFATSRHRESVDVGQYFSDHTKELIQQAAQVALEYGRKEIDTEHVLYAIVDSPVVQEILAQFKIKPDDIRGYVATNAPKEAKVEREQLGISPRVKSVLERAFGIAQGMGHGYVGPEHLLVGLVEENDGMAGDLLRKYGLTAESLRQKTVKVVGKGAQEGTVDDVSQTPELDKYSRDLSRLARQGRLDPVIGRAKEIETTIEILARRTKNNPVLIGEPGVGKTAIVEGLAQRIFAGKVPQVLRDKRVVEVNLNAMVAGSRYRGEFEERIKKVLDEIGEHQDELIVFVDELHTIVGAGAGGGEGGLDVANVIKPALARGELHLIGATTLSEYQKHIEKDAALERRFQPVLVGEPTVEQTIEILRGLRDKYEAHHKVKITDEAIVTAAELSDRYLTNRFLPDKAIDLVDQAASRVRIGSDTVTLEVEEADREIDRLSREREFAKNHRQHDKAKELEREIAQAKARKDEAIALWRKERGVTSTEVTPTHIAQIISGITGIPVTELTQEEREKLLKMEERLHERVIGQDEAIQAVADAVRVSRAGLSKGSRPIATFLFLGPTGVGKTELAKALAQAVFGDEDAMLRIDMSEYMERHAVARLIGSPPGYVGYEEGGQLTEKVRRRPYSVILLDEIEKAHPDVYNVLLQVFDDGRLTDGKGRTVDFTNTIIIATSNLGSSFDAHGKIGYAARPHTDEEKREWEQNRERVMEAVRTHFRPEFINRLDEIIVFQPLDKEQIRLIVRLQLEQVRQVAKGQDVELAFDESLVEHLAEVGYAPEYGARELRRRIKSEVENALAKDILGGKIKEGDAVEVGFGDGQVRFNVLEPVSG